MNHKCFDLSNPNRVRALIGSFAMANPICFHAKDGSGYEFLTDILIKLNSINAHVAARIMTPMISLNRLDLSRKQYIQKCFDKLLKLDGLSTSLFEKIDKALK
jgi:aminopeptidase N